MLLLASCEVQSLTFSTFDVLIAFLEPPGWHSLRERRSDEGRDAWSSAFFGWCFFMKGEIWLPLCVLNLWCELAKFE